MVLFSYTESACTVSKFWEVGTILKVRKMKLKVIANK